MGTFWIILFIAGLVFLFMKIQGLRDEIVKLRYLERSLPEMRDELEANLKVTRRHLAQLAGGDAPAQGTILEGLPYTDLAPADAKKLYDDNKELTVLDVRTPQEFEAGHIDKAKNIPINNLESQVSQVSEDTDKPVLVYCASGARSLAACELLSQKGFSRIYHLPTGYASWPDIGKK